ncbi:MAG: HIT domain-containing protein [Acidobacteriota bacterium]
MTEGRTQGAIDTDLASTCDVCGCTIPRSQVHLENEHCWFLRKPQAVLVGSGIIMPKVHRDTLFDLSPEEWVATREILLAAKQLIDRELSPGGYNVGWNCGDAGGQQRRHAHLHVIPRFADEPHAGKGIRWWFNQEENLRPAIRCATP